MIAIQQDGSKLSRSLRRASRERTRRFSDKRRNNTQEPQNESHGQIAPFSLARESLSIHLHQTPSPGFPGLRIRPREAPACGASEIDQRRASTCFVKTRELHGQTWVLSRHPFLERNLSHSSFGNATRCSTGTAAKFCAHRTVPQDRRTIEPLRSKEERRSPGNSPQRGDHEANSNTPYLNVPGIGSLPRFQSNGYTREQSATIDSRPPKLPVLGPQEWGLGSNPHRCTHRFFILHGWGRAHEETRGKGPQN